MNKVLKIAKEISLPISAVTETFATIGRRGAGKSYLASVIAEQMLDAEAQVVVVDPVGTWWGLRVGKDGKSKGKEIFVIGGEHGDVPLIPEAGKRIAQLIVEKGISAIVDVSGFRMGEHKRFAAEFAEEFFHLKKVKKSPVHIFIEEAQTLIPQRVGPDEARMVGAFERIVRLGRNYGIGCTLITQRPQSVNKEVLSQVECLCVLQVTGLHERKAIEGWVQERGADRTLIGELPGLERGEGYVWSPAWLKIYKRVHFASKETFDASATPVVGRETKAASIQAVDVEKLKKDMADVVEKAEQEDPTALKKKVAQLKRELLDIEKQGRAVNLPVAMGVSQWMEYGTKYGYDNFFKKKELDPIIKDVKDQFDNNIKFTQALVKDLEAIKKITERVQRLPENKMEIHKIPMRYSITKDRPVKQELIITNIPNVKESIDEVFGVSESPLRAGAMKMLNWLHSVYPESLTKQRLATLSGFSVKGGTFNTYISELKRKGWIDQNGENLYITEEGTKYSVMQDFPSGQELIDLWRSKFRAGAGNMLQVIFNTKEITKEELGRVLDFEPTGGTFNTYLSELRRNGLIIISGENIGISNEF